MTAHLQVEDYTRAERAINARQSGYTFVSVRKALEWFYVNREKLQSPLLRQQHTEPAPYRADLGEKRSDTRVLIQVDGGKGGDIDGAFATLVDISRAIESCCKEYPRGMEALRLLIVTTQTQTQIATERRVTQQSLSIEIGKAESFLKGAFSHAGILR